MSEELLKRGLLKKVEKVGKWNFYNIGDTNIRALKSHGIIPNLDYKKFERRKPDGLLVEGQKVIAVIESKIPSEINTAKKQAAVVQDWLDVARALQAPILVVTDNTSRTIWVNTLRRERITNEEGHELTQAFDPASSDTVKLLEKILNSIDENNSQLTTPELKDPSRLAKQIWQDIWSVSGATPENCLYTFVELFIFKYLSDLNVLQGQYSFDHLLKQYETNNPEEVLETYANNIRPKIKELFPASERDKTTIINGTIFVSKTNAAVKGYSGLHPLKWTIN